MAALFSRKQIEQKLTAVFPAAQADPLVEVLDNIREVEATRAAETQALRQGLTTLTEEVQKLAEAQRHTDATVAQLAEAQRRTDATVAELAEAQRRTDASVAELAEAQRDTQKALAELSRAVGSLVNTFGFSLEEFVAALLPPYLERHYNISNLKLERRYFELNGAQPIEVDLVGEGRRAAEPVIVLAECRTTLGGAEVRRLAEKLAAVAASLRTHQVVKVIVAMNVHPSAEKAAVDTDLVIIPYSRINRDRG